jgi:hypothetical protein
MENKLFLFLSSVPLGVKLVVVLLADLLWLLYYFGYATAEVYNLREKGKYRYLGRRWLETKGGRFCLRISRTMVEESVTTQYRIVLPGVFAGLHEGGKIAVDFAGEYELLSRIERSVEVKNHVATSPKL